jgi:hypothetical protein
MIWRLEVGRGDELTLRQLDGIVRALSARLDLHLSWNGEALDGLLDADHASLVDIVATELRSLGWEMVVEATFNIRGERGSIDVLGFHPPTGTVLAIEVKSVVPDVQATLLVLDRKTRLVREIARQRGWTVRGVGRVLVLAEGRTTRRRVAAHDVTFATAFPNRTVAVRRWLRAPDPSRPFSGLWFLADARGVSARQRMRAGASRVVRD